VAKKTWLAFGCTHIPHDDKVNSEWVLEQIRERQPQLIVCLGDLIDFESVSLYGKVNTASLKVEFNEASEFLEKVNDAAPHAKKIFKKGNHEGRGDRPENAHLQDVIDPRIHVKPLKAWDTKNWEYIQDPQHTFTSGQLTFWHGKAYTVSGKSECKEGIDLSCGCAYGLYIHVHTHRPINEQVSLNNWKLPFWRMNVGAGINFEWAKRDYANRFNISQWAHAIGYGWHETKRRFDGKRNWAAELIIRKGAWD